MGTIPKETSCYSTALVIKYARERGYPEEKLFEGIEDRRTLLENQHEWIDLQTQIKLMENFEFAGGNAYKAGNEITKNQVSHFQLLFLKVASLPLIISNYSKHFEKNISPLINLTISKKSKGILEICFRPQQSVKYSKQICDFNRGCAFAAAELKQFRNLNLIEIACAARSDASECRYRITWTPDPPFFERLKNFFLFRVSSQKAILSHMEETYNHLQEQYKEILGIKDFYTHIMANVNEGILWLDGEGKVSFTNKGFCSIIQRENTNDIIGTDFRTFLSNDSMREKLSDIYEFCRIKPQIPELIELTFSTARNGERYGQVACLWVDSTAQQKPGFLLSIRDITDKRAIENRLYAVENRYRALYENSPAIIVGIDKQGYILYVNPAMTEQSGYPDKELIGRHFSQLVAPPDSKVDADVIMKRLSGRVGLQETHYRTKSGEWKSVTLATFPLYNDTWEEIGLGAIGVDVTETKRLNEMLVQTQRMDLLGQMAGGLAHDFKNLLSVISGYGKLITKISTETKVKEYANNLMVANERAFSLTKNLLTFSRGETVKDVPFVINEVVDEVGKLLPAILSREVYFSMDATDTLFNVKGDAGKINQCLLNLCINARDAMVENGGGSLTMRLHSDDDPGRVLIEVEDTGPGIPPNVIARVFDPFFTTKKKGEGTGLGLSVVYGIVKSHGGDITVDSRPGDGTTFAIRLPLFSEKTTMSSDVSGKADTTALTILVTHTDVVFRNYCTRILEHQGYQVIPFTSVGEVAEWLQKNRDAKTLLLLSGMSAGEAKILPGFNNQLIPLWVVEENEEIPESSDYSLQCPFSPAALVAAVRNTEPL